MKTKLTVLMSLAVAGFCAQTIRAEEVLMDIDGDGYAEVVNLDQLDESSFRPTNNPAPPPICGGADDDQTNATPSLCGGADDDQKTGPRKIVFVCSGMDDDQIVGGDGADFVKPFTPHGIVSDTLGLITSSQGPYQMQGTQTNGYTSVQYPYSVASPALGTANQLFTSVQGPYQVQGTSPAPIAGGNGNDTYTGLELTNQQMDQAILQMMTTGRICGWNGNDSLHGNDGSDTLWGGGGTDEYMGDGMDDLDLRKPAPTQSGLIYGETGSDSLKPAAPTNSFVFGTTSYGFVFGTTSY